MQRYAMRSRYLARCESRLDASTASYLLKRREPNKTEPCTYARDLVERSGALWLWSL